MRESAGRLEHTMAATRDLPGHSERLIGLISREEGSPCGSTEDRTGAILSILNDRQQQVSRAGR